MFSQLVSTLGILSLALFLLAGGCSGDEPATKAEAAPDADVLRVLGVPAAPGGAAGKGEEQTEPVDAGNAPVGAAALEKSSGASRPLKVEISEPRFDSGKQAPAPRVSQSPGSSLDY